MISKSLSGVTLAGFGMVGGRGVNSQFPAFVKHTLQVDGNDPALINGIDESRESRR
jgi:hypothetical protein